jgi:hypothetical protein
MKPIPVWRTLSRVRLRLVLEASLRGVKVLGHYEWSCMRPCACEPHPGIALLLWRQGNAPNPQSLETAPRGPALCNGFRLAGGWHRPARACRIDRGRTAHRHRARRSRHRARACRCLRRAYPPDHPHAGRLPYAQHTFQHGHGPGAKHRRQSGSSSSSPPSPMPATAAWR